MEKTESANPPRNLTEMMHDIVLGEQTGMKTELFQINVKSQGVIYPCHSCEIPRAHVRANTEKMRDYHLVARMCDNEVGVAISIRDPYTSPFTSRCK